MTTAFSNLRSRTPGHSLPRLTGHNVAGRLAKTLDANGLATKYQYDGAGRTTAVYTTDDAGGSNVEGSAVADTPALIAHTSTPASTTTPPPALSSMGATGICVYPGPSAAVSFRPPRPPFRFPFPGRCVTESAAMQPTLLRPSRADLRGGFRSPRLAPWATSFRPSRGWQRMPAEFVMDPPRPTTG
jgi:YD repeat-containing protein